MTTPEAPNEPPQDTVPADVVPADAVPADAVVTDVVVTDGTAEPEPEPATASPEAGVVAQPADAVAASHPAQSEAAAVAATPAAVGDSAGAGADAGTASDEVGAAAAVAAAALPEAAHPAQPVVPTDAGAEQADAATPAAVVEPAGPVADAVPAEGGATVVLGKAVAAAAPDGGATVPAAGGDTVVLGKADPRVPVVAETVAAPVVAEAVAAEAMAAVPAQRESAVRESAVQPPAWVQPQPSVAAAPQAGAGAVWAVPVEYLESAPRKERPWLRTVARWGSAAAVAVVVAAVSAALVTLPARTGVPGLATPSDGRWSFPALSLPALPPGQSVDNDVSQHVHRVDLRKLLLPAPAGAAKAGQGWMAKDAFLKLLATPMPAEQAFDDVGLRHIAVTGWTMPDGTRTDVYLQQFRSTYSANAADSVEALSGVLQAAQGQQLPISPDLGAVNGSSVREVAAGAGAPDTVYGYFQIGDVEMVVVMTNPHKVPIVNFEQVVQLENRLLSA